jgi:hemerythrin
LALFNWNDSYSVNIKEIDSQHKILIGLINELHDGMKVGKGKDILKKILDELVKYTVYHFDHEEKLFTSYKYPESSPHKMAHTNLIQQVKSLKENYDKGKTVLSMDVMNFLKDWLVNHIIGTDKKYSIYLNGKGVS